ncbi:hypothetical protein [Sphingomonas sp. 28-63-12]|uniref:hypothetical protein n=1 Tax=Sphingomonas sp. 28-63-12 TaxID=1970434 RepID=UPI0035A9AAEB
MIAGGKGNDALRSRFGIDCGKAVPRAAQLERANRLQTLGFKRYGHPFDLVRKQGRKWQDFSDL